MSAWEAEVQAKWKSSSAKGIAVDLMILEYIFASFVCLHECDMLLF
jgi:hypothetical protein